MNIKLISLGVCLALASLNASAGLVIEDGAPSQAKQGALASSTTTPSAPASLSSGSLSNTSQSNTSQTSVAQATRPSGFEWRRYGAPPTQSATINSHNDYPLAVTQSGRRPSSVATAGWAKDLPLSLALRQVVPPDFEIKENGVSLDRNVSWDGDRPWDQVLNSLANTGDFLAHIDWAQKEVSLAPRLVGAVRPQSPAPAVASQPSQPVQPVVAAPVAAAKPAPFGTTSVTISERAPTPSNTFVAAQRPIAPPAATWTLEPSMTLRENVEQWAKKAGWTVIWEGADYPIAAKANFTGDFASTEGPLAHLIAAYETSDQPLVANLTTMDKVVFVKNKYHENTQVVQTSPQAIGNNQ